MDNLDVLLKEIGANTTEDAVNTLNVWKELLANAYSFILTVKDGSPILIQRANASETEVKWLIIKENQFLCKDTKEFAAAPENCLFDTVIDAITFGQFLS